MKNRLLLFLLLAFSSSIYTQTAKPEDQKAAETKPMVSSGQLEGRNTLEMVFVVDTTGSMGGLIEGAKQRIWGVINEVMQAPSKPRVRVGLVAYRDEGDEYVTKVLPITEDLDKVYTTLMSYKADGGGDTPENVRKALAEGVKSTGWSAPGDRLAQILFLVGDAPPQKYEQEPDVLDTTMRAVKKNMIVNAIQCGSIAGTREVWQTIAARGEGKYFAIAEDGGVAVISTPFDTKLADLAAKIGETYITYGSSEVQALNMTAQATVEVTVNSRASMNARVDRAVNKAVNTFQYDGDLIQAIENGTVKLEDVKEKDLPPELKKLSATERKKEVERRIEERKKIRAEILELSKKRDAFLIEEKRKLGTKNAFDTAVSEALREQLLRRGIK